MRILWFTNSLLPEIAKKNGITASVNEGWLVGMSSCLTGMCDDLSLGIVCSQNASKELLTGRVANYEYFAYYEQRKEEYDSNLHFVFENIINTFLPDIIHVMGSEFPHALSVMEAAENVGLLDSTVLSIQGLVTYCSLHLREYLNQRADIKKSFRDVIKKGGIANFYKEYYKRGEYEVKAFQKVRHVIGRTDWDKGCAFLLNPEITYHFNNEILRPEFYGGKWNLEKCRRHSIFFSQISNPIKGFDSMLRALAIIKKKYPDVMLNAAGSHLFIEQENMPKWRRSGFVNHIFELIKKYDLKDNIHFCGSLDAINMRNEYLKANVFVCSSLIENSPNSVGEAMILGVPTVTSHVGGVGNMMNHGKEGFIYPQDEEYMLAYYVELLFEDNALANKLSQNAIERANRTHSPQINCNELLHIYKRLYSK